MTDLDLTAYEQHLAIFRESLHPHDAKGRWKKVLGSDKKTPLLTDPANPPDDVRVKRTAHKAAMAEAASRATDVASKSHDHGPKHWRDVSHMGLAQIKAGVPADPDVLLLFGAMHDTQRFDEWQDPEHGPRAAQMAREMRADGHLDHLTEDQYNTLFKAMEVHNGAPGDPDPTIGAALDADRYTLWRVGIEPNFKFMSGEKNGHLTEMEMEELKAYGAKLQGTKGFSHDELLDQWQAVTEGRVPQNDASRAPDYAALAKLPEAENLPKYARTNYSPPPKAGSTAPMPSMHDAEKELEHAQFDVLDDLSLQGPVDTHGVVSITGFTFDDATAFMESMEAEGLVEKDYNIEKHPDDELDFDWRITAKGEAKLGL